MWGGCNEKSFIRVLRRNSKNCEMTFKGRVSIIYGITTRDVPQTSVLGNRVKHLMAK
jgi:hypothetical protein